jgi:hypothetical protein
MARGARARRSRRETVATTAGRPGRSTLGGVDIPEETRELRDVTIRVRETRPGFFEANLKPTSPETHLARGGYTLDTARGLRGRTLGDVLDRAEAHWRQNYPLA